MSLKQLDETIKNRPDVLESIPTLGGAIEYAKLVNKHLDRIKVEFNAFKKQLEELMKTKPKLFFDNDGKPKYIHGYISGAIECFEKLDLLLEESN